MVNNTIEMQRWPATPGGQSYEGRMGFFERLTRNELLDRALERPHLTGIAVSGTIGIGLFIRTGEIIGLAGALGTVLAYLISGLVVASVMLCLSEMVSVRHVAGAIFEYPGLYVDPALGFAVGIIYWLAYTTSMVSVLVTAATLFNDDPPKTAGIVVAIIVSIGLSNILGGVQWYGSIEWVFKWIKLTTVVILFIVMIIVNRVSSIGLENYGSDYIFAPGFNSSGYQNRNGTRDALLNLEIPGPWGAFLGVWQSIILAAFAFIGVEIVVVASGEAKHPGRDLPSSSKRIYILTIILYVVAAFTVSLNVKYNNPGLLPFNGIPGNTNDSRFSPFIIAIKDAGLSGGLESALNVLFIVSAWTTANTNIYTTSRTLFALSSNSDVYWIRESLGRTSLNGTPVCAIIASFLPSLFALTAVWNDKAQLVLSVFSQIATISIFCVYIAECVAFVRFQKGISIQRDSEDYKRRYFRVPRQPYIAYVGIASCAAFIIFNGWHVFVQIHNGSLDSGMAFVQLMAAYFGPVLFAALFAGYKIYYKLPPTDPTRFLETFSRLDDDDPNAKRPRMLKRIWLHT